MQSRELKIARSVVAKKVLAEGKVTMTDANGLAIAGSDFVGNTYYKINKPTINESDFKVAAKAIGQYVEKLSRLVQKSTVVSGGHVFYSPKDDVFVGYIAFKRLRGSQYDLNERIEEIKQAQKQA